MSLTKPFSSAIPLPLTGRIARWAKLLPVIESHGKSLADLSTGDLRKRSLSLRYQAKSHEPLNRLLPEAFALVREAAHRTLGIRHYDVQMLAGIAMHFGSIVEMQTGEGKTLTATLPIYLNALSGRGVHIATVNDYLAKRDAEWMGPIYELLGIKVGIIQGPLKREERREAYACDVTYGTAGEFGFDFLRDRLLGRRVSEGFHDLIGGMLGAKVDNHEEPVHRNLNFMVVDEADSVLVDAASTPLIISVGANEKEDIVRACYRWSCDVASQFAELEHYVYDAKKRTVELTTAGRKLCRKLPKPAEMDCVGIWPTYEYVERAIRVNHTLFRDQQYVVREGRVVIVDEYSGRPAEGRMWLDGSQQAVEAREGVHVNLSSSHAARVTVQDFCSRYEGLCGMTGTARSAAREFRKIYKVRVRQIPTHRPAIRKRWPERILGTSELKWAAIVEEICQLRTLGRPVLIGTRSIDKSLILSHALDEAGIEHQVLNAYQIAREAEIVARAGERGQVTVSTNMAGRGTDIQLGDGVAELGGLHVILSEMHEAARIDRQLIGRCGRQGDPGSYRQYLSLDDELLLLGLGPQRAEWLIEYGRTSPGPFEHLHWVFRKAQRIVERKHFHNRKSLMQWEKDRQKMQRELGQDPCIDSAH